MPRSKKTKKDPLVIKIKNNPGLLIVVAALFFGGLWYSYQAIARYQEKKQFKQAEVAIQSVVNTITTQVEQPQDMDSSSHCSYVSRKEGNGPRSCSVSTTLAFRSKSNDDANELREKIDQIENNDNNLLKSLNCYVNYGHEGPFGTKFWEETVAGTKNDFYVEITCTGPARAEYYPVD
jgi:hypothetical protein